MKALRWHGRRDVRYEDVDEPRSPGPGEVRLTVEWCGICGTDLEEYRDGPIVISTEPHALTGSCAPLVIGHEVAGRIAEVGAGVESVAPEQMVAVDGFIWCGACAACIAGRVNLCQRWAFIGMGYPGGLAEQMTLPANTVVAAPADVPADHLALAEPFAVAVRATARGGVGRGDRVLVLGAGTIGLATAQVALTLGAAEVVVVEPLKLRQDVARSLGPIEAVEPGADLDGFDVAFDCAGATATPPIALDALRDGGRAVLVGLSPDPGPFDYLAVVLRELELVGSLGHVCDADTTRAVDLIAHRRVDVAPLITHRVPLERAVTDGIELLAGDRAGDALKILVHP